MAVQYHVLLTRGAEQDLEAIHEYIAAHDAPENADRVLDRLMATAEGLASMPERGSHPHELLELGVKEYRQVFFKPYRLIYRIVASEVLVFIIADGRRDMQSLLARRLLGA